MSWSRNVEDRPSCRERFFSNMYRDQNSFDFCRLSTLKTLSA